MKPCPTAQELEHLLDEELSDAQHEALAAACRLVRPPARRLWNA